MDTPAFPAAVAGAKMVSRRAERDQRRPWSALMVSQVERGQGGWTGAEMVELFHAIGLDFFAVLEGTERIAIGNPKLKVMKGAAVETQ